MKILDILFPHRCLECDNIIKSDEILCVHCLDKVSFTHWEFGDNPLKRKAEFLFPIENAFALMYFEKLGLSRKIIHQLKYNNQEQFGEVLAKWVLERVDFKGEKPDFLVAVPLHPKKQKERGYNQLHRFSGVLSKSWNIPFKRDLLQRNTYNQAQATKDKKLRGATNYDFSIAESITNQHILIIDDVFTTGNTMSSIAWKFLEQKNKVSILVMAMD